MNDIVQPYYYVLLLIYFIKKKHSSPGVQPPETEVRERGGPSLAQGEQEGAQGLLEVAPEAQGVPQDHQGGQGGA